MIVGWFFYLPGLHSPQSHKLADEQITQLRNQAVSLGVVSGFEVAYDEPAQ
jgi:hypothetical protein